ncbi:MULTISPECIES: hypothetical protein [unclassified Clostridium]|uniref:hypothetical protein n=1 Tax=unclassified Clostridium TaxID=2614128 RepID=UPI0025BAA818|nr:MULTISPECIES: hypothetical protein [unclassified Clostridium]
MKKSKEQLLKERRQNTLKKTRIKNAITLIIFILMISYLFFCVFTMAKNITTRIINKKVATSSVSKFREKNNDDNNKSANDEKIKFKDKEILLSIVGNHIS